MNAPDKIAEKIKAALLRLRIYTKPKSIPAKPETRKSPVPMCPFKYANNACSTVIICVLLQAQIPTSMLHSQSFA